MTKSEYIERLELIKQMVEDETISPCLVEHLTINAVDFALEAIDKAAEHDKAMEEGRLVELPHDDYTFTIRGDIMRGIILTNCRHAGTEVALDGGGESGQ